MLTIYCAAAAVTVLACARPSSAAESVRPLVIGETFTIDSAVLAESRRINIYRPMLHGDSAVAPLPVLYMPDGGIAEDFLHIAGLVQILVANNSMRPFLLVGIENTERRRDMTGPTESAEDRKIAPRVGGAAAFRRFIREELMPQVGARYRVTEESAIIGESLAGLFVLETLVREPQLFDAYIAVDPSLWWNHYGLIAEARAHWRNQRKMPRATTLYIATSDERGIAEGVERMVELLQNSSPMELRWHHESMPQERHQTIFHPAALTALRTVLGASARPER